MKKRKAIKEFRGYYNFLSNFWPCKIKRQKIIYPSVEHAFQAAKTLSIQKRKIIAQLSTPEAARRAGRKLVLRNNWEDHKESIMYCILIKKFKEPSLKRKLLATGNASLIEGNNWGDTYWGVCCSKGKNRLDKLLMRIRKSLTK